MKTIKCKKGVTIMEMLVVLVIIGMLSVIAMPTFFGFTKNSRLRGASRLITSALRNARSYAITQRINYTVAIYLTDNAVSIYETPDNVKKINVSEPAVIDIRSPQSIPGSLGYREFTFRPDGTTTGTTDSIWVYDKITEPPSTDPSGVRFIEIKIYSATGSIKTGDIDLDI